MKHLVLTLEAPMMAFGGEAIDNYGITRNFLSASMLTGLIANALGWQRTEWAHHQALQDRLIFAARIDCEPFGPLRDFQTAQLGATDKGWTTRGIPAVRAGGSKTYESPHLRYRDYWADMCVTVAVRLQMGDIFPTLDDLAKALAFPARPLFIGRKSCLPSTELVRDWCDSNTVLEALLEMPLIDAQRSPEEIRLMWPDGEGANTITPSHTYILTDQRNWRSGLHGGGRSVCEATIPKTRFPPVPNAISMLEGK